MILMKSKGMRITLLGLMLALIATAIDDEDVGNANDYVDTALENLRKDSEISNHLDPLTVPDSREENYNLRNIKIRGLLSLYRHGDCSLSYDDDIVNVLAEVAVNDVSVTLDYSAKALFFWVHGSGDISVDKLAVKLDFSSTDGYAHLNSFKVIHLGEYKVRKMTGMSFALNWLLKLIANNIAQGSRQNIINALEKEAGKALGDLLKKTKLPIL